MLESLDGAQASVNVMMHETAVALVEQLLVLRHRKWRDCSNVVATVARCCSEGRLSGAEAARLNVDKGSKAPVRSAAGNGCNASEAAGQSASANGN